MQVTLTVDDDAEVARSLVDWLRREPDLRGIGISQVALAPTTGKMGAGGAVVQIVSDNSEFLTAIATTVGVWLGSRIRRTQVRVRVGEREVEIESNRRDDPTKIAMAILKALDNADEGGNETHVEPA
jgi:hypothetical protein